MCAQHQVRIPFFILHFKIRKSSQICDRRIPIMKRKSILYLAFILIIMFTVSSCTVAAIGDQKSSIDNKTTRTSLEAPDPLRVFYVTGGHTIPEDFDYANNKILNIIAEKANVKITEAVVPPWSDISTKYNLMMSSGNLCDVVHYNGPQTINNDGKNGAFLELTSIISSSSGMKKNYLQFTEQLKADDGNIYCLRTLPSDGDINNLFFFRWDVLQDLGYTEVPDTLDEWLDAMRALKKKYPDSIPYTSMDNLHWTEFVFNSFGITGRGNGWQQYFGKAIHSFEHPLYKDALKVYKTMLDEGLMDPEFVTSKRQDFDDKRYNKKVLVNQQNLGASMVFASRFMNVGVPEARTVPGIWPFVDDERVDTSSVYEGVFPVGNYCVAIASTSKVKDAAIRFVEELITEDTQVLTTWGIEDIDYKVIDGQKHQIYDDGSETQDLTPAKGLYSWLFAVNTRMNIDKSFKNTLNDIKIANPGISNDDLDAYTKISWDYFNKALDINNSHPTYVLNKFISLNADTASRQTEAGNEALTIIIKTMRGDISFDEFDIQSNEFLKKYQFITDEYNEKLPAALDKVKD